jgi:uncharacterized protein YlzI (FlbEa/FlbD family)
MNLVPFTCGSGRISINPQHVVTVRAADPKDKTTIFLVTGGQIIVDGTPEEVARKLAGDTA